MNHKQAAKTIQARLKKLEKDFSSLDGQQVSFDEIFTPNFMRAHSIYDSIQALLDDSDFKLEKAEDFFDIPRLQWDRHIRNRTDFDNWEEMKSAAVLEWAKPKLGLY